MKSRPRPRPRSRRAAIMALPVLWLILPGFSGCQLNRSFFQMDSDSRSPYFGVDLAPRWPKRSSSVEGVSRLQSEPAEAAKSLAPSEDTSVRRKSLTLPLGGQAEVSSDAAPVELFR